MTRLCKMSAGGDRRAASPEGWFRSRTAAAAATLGIRPQAALAACLCASLLACDDGSSTAHELAPSRVVDAVGRDIQWNASPAERHGISARDFGGAVADDASAAGSSSGLHWQTPPGWKEKPAAAFREVNLQVGDDPRAECYLATLGGAAGGLESNLNRWRAQLSLPPLTAGEIAALPRVPWLGGQAVLADFAGRWTGMSGGEAQDGWRLVGLVLVQPDQSRFLKMVGPNAVIAPEIDAFHALADSFHEGGAARASPPPATTKDATRGAQDSPHVPTAAAATAAAAGAVPTAGGDSQQSASLSWRAPSGWRRGPDKAMREVTYFAGEGDAVECWVTLLPGDAGGVLANINRWCGQMGAAPLTDADVAQLERVPIAGTEGVLVRIARGEKPGAADAREQLEGVVCLLAGRALFVKLTGPREAVAGQQTALIQFCASLKAPAA